MITVAPFPWQLVCLSSKQQNIASFAHFFHLDYQGKQIVTENLLSATTTFGPERGSLFATFPPRTTRYFIIIRETPRNELLTKKPVITLYQQSNQSAGGNNLYFPIFDVHYVISMVSYRPKYSTNQRARNRSGIVKIVKLISRLQCGGKGYNWYKMRQGEFWSILSSVA